jgi:glycosyltransferase involved in cell wall biosynthesis
MPRVLLLCEYATLNGGEHSMLATLAGLVRAGFAPISAAPANGPLSEALKARGVEIVPFEVRDGDGRHRPIPELRQELTRLLADIRPDLLHANSLSMGRLSGPVAAAARIPNLAHLRDILKLGPQAIADLNCHTRLLAVSHATRNAHVAQGLHSEKVHVLYNGVDLDRFRPRPPSGFLHRELGLPPEAHLIGTIGQISLRKGQDVLVKAAMAVIAEKGSEKGTGTFCRNGPEGAAHKRCLSPSPSPGAHFLIIGQRFSQKTESQQFEADLIDASCGPLLGRLHFLGVRDDVDRILNELTLLVHPARQEPLGRVLLEAASSGVTVIATDVGGTREIFPPSSDSARLIAPDDADALASSILDLLHDEAARCRLAANALRRAEQTFDVRVAVAGLLEQYKAVLCGLRLIFGRP